MKSKGKKVLIISKSDLDGGAAVAAYRLFKALKNNIAPWKTDMLVQKSISGDLDITALLKGKSGNYISLLSLALEKLYFKFFEKSKAERFQFSLANTGIPIIKKKIVQDADIIHLHYITQGFLSLKTLQKLFETGKPIVWTLHDMWPFTGGCHYSGDCMNFKTGCENCKFLKRPSKNDLSSNIFRNKKNIYRNKNINIVTCSKWLADVARESLLLKNFRIINIPNPIDQTEFYSINKADAKSELGLSGDKIQLLFAAGNIFDERKGIKYIVEALNELSKSREIKDKIELLVMGKSNYSLDNYFPVKVNYLGQVWGAEKLRVVYNAADAFLLPSLQDNLPNTIMESLACGTPIIAFKTGGVPEMIIHGETGFLAKEKSSESICEGIMWLAENYKKDFQSVCKKFVTENYSEKKVSEQYLQLYKSLISYEK